MGYAPWPSCPLPVGDAGQMHRLVFPSLVRQGLPVNDHSSRSSRDETWFHFIVRVCVFQQEKYLSIQLELRKLSRYAGVFEAFG